jgi:hypothetical protein
VRTQIIDNSYSAQSCLITNPFVRTNIVRTQIIDNNNSAQSCLITNPFIQTTLTAADCVDGDGKRSAVRAVASLPRRPAGIAETAPASAQHAVTAIRTLHVASTARAALVLPSCSVLIKCHVFSGVLTGRQCTKLRAGHGGVRCPTGSTNAQATAGARITCYVGCTYTIQVNYSFALRVRAC